MRINWGARDLDRRYPRSQVMTTTLQRCLLTGILVGWLPAQETADRKLKIVIVEGEGAINNIRLRTAREPIVEVQDENNRPVGGAAVTFLLPNQGAGGTFLDGSRTLTVVTDDTGRAAGRGFKPNSQTGQYQIRVTASSMGQTASATITQTNVLVAAAAAGAAGAGTAAAAGAGKIIAIVAIAAGAAVGGGVVAAKGGGKSAAPPAAGPSRTTIVAGTPVVNPP